MLQLTVVTVPEKWDAAKREFISAKEQTIQLEHSLVSLSKWEAKWCKPFLSKEEKTRDELIDYIKCMTITQNVNPEIYDKLSAKNLEEVRRYIELPMTATRIPKSQQRGGGSYRGEQVTSEIIYYWMVALSIPFECQKWHLKRLLTLIQVCNLKNQPPKKMSKQDILSRNAALNASRRKRLNTKG